MVRIENWQTATDIRLYAFVAPEIRSVRLSGQVYGHPNTELQDGDNVVTSRCIGWIPGGPGEPEHFVTNNTVYELGKPNPVWSACYPDYLERLKALTKPQRDLCFA